MEQLQTYTRQEVADILKISLSTVGILIREKRIFSVRAGRAIRVPAYAVEDYLKGHKPRGAGANPLAADDGQLHGTPSVFRGDPVAAHDGETPETPSMFTEGQ